ncbi:AP-1 complex subunit beta-1 isoform X1 [Oopsacas minuta]|uniref:AP complex subunit beta n=1 Tax=Oopsacas minuta TaxID=111878 RepID=A0AAV7K294_9METZ|nr:AP-1 complex subunit beta-1 isoform X1 [Oopsacas minuta]
MADAKYFTTTKKGEIAELRIELRSDRRERRKEAVKKVIASMTVGKDVGSLFPDVVNCIQTDNLELKKLVYLYVLNYAKSQPDLTLMSVNTFVRDSADLNPLIRALAIRTMGCIRVDRIIEHICEPLRKCLKDEDPYVRKTAAICVAKLNDMNPSLVEDQGFLDLLKDLLADPNPMVVANSVAALSEISDCSPTAAEATKLDYATISKLLAALNECTEWGQVFILDAVAQFEPQDGQEAQSICERVVPRLAHGNAAVVLSAVKCLMKYFELIPDDSEYKDAVLNKLAPPLVTLLSAEPELQYVALRNINLIVQRKPEIMKQEIKVFFVKYNDPIYVKLEKLDIMIRLTSVENIVQVLSELKEYASEVDVDFVRKSVRAIGRCAIKVDSSAERCVRTLLDLIQTKVSYVVQEAVIVIRDIFRKYPNQYEEVIDPLCKNLDNLDEPEARASMIWIIGEYGERIDNSAEILSTFVDGFQEESTQVQLQLLTSVVKLFLKHPTDTQDLVQKVLNLATQESDNPDLRDRGYIYWRLLSTDPVAAKNVVLAEKPLISEETDLLEPAMLRELLAQIATLSSVYHKPPNSFIDGRVPLRQLKNPVLEEITAVPPELQNEDSLVPETESQTSEDVQNPSETITPQVPEDNLLGDLLSLDLSSPLVLGGMNTFDIGGSSQRTMIQSGGDLLGDLGGIMFDPVLPNLTQTTQNIQNVPMGTTDVGFDIFNQYSTPVLNPFQLILPKQVVLPAAKGKGLEVSVTFARRNKDIYMDLTLFNKALLPLKEFAIKFNKNSFALAPAGQLNIVTALQPNKSIDVSLAVNNTNPVEKMEPLNKLDVAIKTEIATHIFTCFVPYHVLFSEDGKLDPKTYLEAWKQIPDANESVCTIDTSLDSQGIIARLEANNIFNTTVKSIEGQELLYMTNKFMNNLWVLSEIKISNQFPVTSVLISMKSRTMEVVPGVFDSVRAMLAT